MTDWERSPSGLLVPPTELAGSKRRFVHPVAAQLSRLGADLDAMMIGGDWEATPQDFNSIVITPFSPESLGNWGILSNANGNIASTAWGTANNAMYVPFLVYQTLTIVAGAVYNGATATGNIDVGICDDQNNVLVTLGATAQSGTSAWQSFSLTSTTLRPGTYYMMLSFSSATATVFATGLTTILKRCVGVLAQASANPLPTTTTSPVVATIGLQDLPLFALSTRSWL